MLKCSCGRQTKPGEPIGRYNTIVYVDPKDKSKGKRIFKSKEVCMDCSGEVLLK